MANCMIDVVPYRGLHRINFSANGDAENARHEVQDMKCSTNLQGVENAETEKGTRKTWNAVGQITFKIDYKV